MINSSLTMIFYKFIIYNFMNMDRIISPIYYIKEISNYIDRYWKAMEKVECPFLEVRGKESITVGDETIEKMKKANKFFSSVDVEGAGHEVTTDKPYEFIEVTKGFLGL